jgi:hypothetical protein
MSMLSSLWKRYGRRINNNNNCSRRLSDISLQSSTISGIGFRGFRGAHQGSNDDNQEPHRGYDDGEVVVVDEEGLSRGRDVMFDISSLSTNFSGTGSDESCSLTPLPSPTTGDYLEVTITAGAAACRVRDAEAFEAFYDHGRR